MKEFNLEEAKAGKPVCTRDGRKVRILCFDKKCNNFPICALVKGNKGQEITLLYTLDGRRHKGYTDNADLMMASEKHEGWVIIGRNGTERFAAYDILSKQGRGKGKGSTFSKQLHNYGQNRMGGVKRFIIYLMRWQLSGVILAPCIYLLKDYGSIVSAIVANLIGGIIFYWIDKYLFTNKGNKQ